MTSFMITMSKGIHITFDNGYTLSIQWGPGNYGSNYDLEFGPRPIPDYKADTVEVAVWDRNGTWDKYDGDTVRGYVPANEVLDLINTIRARP